MDEPPNDFSHLLPRCVRLSVSRDEDARTLVTSGMGWRSGPRTLGRLITWAIAHPDVVLPLNTPTGIREAIESGRELSS